MPAARPRRTLFSVVRPAIRKADLRNLAALVAAMIGAELEREGLPHNTESRRVFERGLVLQSSVGPGRVELVSA